MPAVKLKERTVAFYEVVRLEGGQQVRCAQLDFPAALASLSRASIDDRRLDSESTLIGDVRTYDEKDHLLLHRVKDQGEWLSMINLTTGTWTELESKAGEGYLDTSAVSFLGYGNVVGMIQGAVSAPSHKALERWMNGLKLFGDGGLVVRPLLSHAEVEKLRTADGASRVEIRIGNHQRAALAGKTGRLASFIRRATRDFGDVNVKLVLSVPRGGARAEDRARLRDDLRDLSDVMPGAADVAKATLTYSDAGGASFQQLAEFVEHHITAKRRVPAVDDEGNSIKLSAALRIIEDVAIEHEEELRLAADVEPAS